MNKPIVSIIICTKDRVDSLKQTLVSLESCIKSMRSPWSAEVVIVDNSAEASAFFAINPCLVAKYFHEPKPGKSIALRRGVAVSSGEILLFTDDDVRFPANWIAEMCSPIINDGFSIVQGGIRPAQHLERPWLVGMLRTWTACVEHPLKSPVGCVGANMAITREAYEAAGGADVRLDPGAAGFFGDTMLGLKAEKAGYRKAYLPGVCVIHHFDEARLTLSGFISIADRMANSKKIAMPAPRESVVKRIYCKARLVLARIHQSLSPHDWVCESFIYWHYCVALNQS